MPQYIDEFVQFLVQIVNLKWANWSKLGQSTTKIDACLFRR